MASNDKTIVNEPAAMSLENVAFELFKSMHMFPGSPEQHAIRCYRNAAAFISMSEKIQLGEVNPTAISNEVLADAYAPNLKKTHPINLMSKEWGSVKKVKEAFAEIKNPEVKEYELYGWKESEINTARRLFPPMLEREAELAKANN